MLYIVMGSDLRTISARNILCKLADDTTLLVPSDADINLQEEYSNVKTWAMENRMLINHSKTKEIVFHRPNPRSFIPHPQ